MGQRVNLQYTIDIDDLPEETRKLIVKGYLAHVSGTNESDDAEQVAQTSSEDLYGLPAGFNMDELQNKLNDFKQTYNDLNSTENEKSDQEQNV